MSRKFITFVLAASIAATGLSAQSARAGDRDLGRALAAIAGIAIVGAAIHDANKDQRRVIRHHQPRKKQLHFQHAPRYNSFARDRRFERQVDRRAERRFERRLERRAYRQGLRHGYGQHRYSARPYGYGN